MISPGDETVALRRTNSAEDVLRRKVREGYSDFQLLVLISLARESLLTLSDLSRALGTAGVSTAWHAAAKLEKAGDVKKDTLRRRFSVTYYCLTEDGKKRLAWILRGDLGEESC